jgi:hypothetical protein
VIRRPNRPANFGDYLGEFEEITESTTVEGQHRSSA